MHCTVNKHCRPEHKYDLVGDTFERHKAEITASLRPVEKQLDVVSMALEQFDLRSQQLDDLQVDIEANIQQQIRRLQELLEARKAEPISQLQQHIQTKKKNLAAQKDEVETIHTQLVSCLSFVKESLKTGSQGEVMKMKKEVVKQIKEMMDNFKPDMLSPCEPVNVKFKSSPELSIACQQFGRVYLRQISPEKCYVTGKGLEVIEPGERSTAVIHIVDHKGKACTKPVETLNCELISESTGEEIDCSVKKTEASQYEISYPAMDQWRYQLHIKVEGEHIKESPFPVTVKLPVKKLGTPIKIISGVKKPWGVAIYQRGEVIVAESNGSSVSIFSPAGEKLRLFGSQGSKFNSLRSIAVDDDHNILVVDENYIQMYTTNGKLISTVGMQGKSNLQFNKPIGITINPQNKKICISEERNHRIRILNSDLTFSSSFGSYGSNNGQLKYPSDVACDSNGNVYVADSGNHRIQVFTTEGQFLNKFGKEGRRNGDLDWPSSIAIDSDNVVYVTENNNHRVSVFTCEGKFLTLFGTNGHCPRGIAVDKSGVVYVSNTYNDHLQLF